MNTSLIGGTRTVHPGVAFGAVAAGAFVANLDMFVVNVALPDIARYYGQTSLGSVSWVLNAYTVVFATLLLAAGSLSQRFGSRTVYLVGLAIFGVASAACSLSPSLWLLVAARVVQAMGAALVVPASLSLVLHTAPAEKRVGYVRGWTAVSAVGAALGPALGGLLTAGGWQWVFWINVPVCAAVLLTAPRVLPPVAGGTTRVQLDLVGAALVMAGFGSLALAVVEGPTWGWSSAPVLTAFVVAAVTLAGVTSRTITHAHAILPRDLLTRSGFRASVGLNLLFAAPFAGMLLSVILWAQEVWHWSALVTGLAVSPGPALVPVFAIVVGPVLLARMRPTTLAGIGSLAFAAGIVWWLVAMTSDGGYTQMLGGMLLTGVGVGLTMPTLIAAAVAPLPPDQFAMGSSVVTMARQLGSVFGVALVVSCLQARHGVAATESGIHTAWWIIIGLAVATTLACLSVGMSPEHPSKPNRRSRRLSEHRAA